MGFSRRFSALNGTALLLGLLAGLASVAFRDLIGFVQALAFEGRIGLATNEGDFIEPVWGLWVFLVPATGGALIGLLKYFFPNLNRQGISEVMASVQARGGTILARKAWGHALLSAITVGTGGSTGREGPIGYIGGAIGSSLGRHLGFRTRDIRVLVGAGVGAGIAATFNAPLGGVLFALELILPEFSTHAFIPLVIATVIAVTVSQVFTGTEPAFLVDGFEFVSPYELGFYLLLGLICGLGGVGFIRFLGLGTRLGRRTKLPEFAKAPLGGLMVGLLGVGVYLLTSLAFFGGEGHFHIYGTGYATVNGILQEHELLLGVGVLVLLMIVKPLASSITIASGGGGGVFSASLYQGALYGALVGLLANAVLPAQHVGGIGSYALVGMGAFYAASGRATLTTIILLTELTDGYSVVLPIMFAAVTADAVSHGISKDSIYTVRLKERGITFEHNRMQSPLDTLRVEDAMTRDVHTLDAEMDVGSAFNEMLQQGHTGYPVVRDGKLLGVVTRKDLSRLLAEGRGDEAVARTCSGLVISVYGDEPLHVARDRIFREDIGRLLVVDRADRTRLLGILTRSDLLSAEAKEDVEHGDMFSEQR